MFPPYLCLGPQPRKTHAPGQSHGSLILSIYSIASVPPWVTSTELTELGCMFYCVLYGRAIGGSALGKLKGAPMAESDGSERTHAWSASTPTSPGAWPPASASRLDADAGTGERAAPDTLEPIAGDAFELDPLALRFPGATPDMLTPEWIRFQARQLIKEFLSAGPRSEPDTALSFLRTDGTTRILTRAQMSAAIDLLRPRQRQIVRLAAWRSASSIGASART